MVNVSVIIPFYSNVKWLIEAVESVLAQDFNDYEIIVINDGSTENISEFLKKYGDKIYYEYQNNSGAAIARNRGIEVATGKYVAFLDSDDVWLPNKLSKQVGMMEKYNTVWSYCGYRTFGEGRSVERKMTTSQHAEVQRYYNSYIATPCVMVVREFFIKHKEYRFNPKLKNGQDIYLWLMLNSNNKILAIPDILTQVRMRGTNAGKLARIQLKARAELWKIRKENRDILITPFAVDVLFCLASELCVVGHSVISWLEKNVCSNTLVEWISKILFVVPWGLFKIDRLLKDNKKEISR